MAVKFPLPSVMASQQHFSQVPTAELQRSTFDRSHGHKTTFNAGYLIPVLVDEVLPGDTYSVKMSALVRLTTPVKPVMDNMYLESFFFFVPYRILWAGWEDFITGNVLGLLPVLGVPFTPQVGTLMDYMGVMVTVNGNSVQTPNAITALPFRAYNLIYNEWFRDQNLVTALTVPTGNGPDGTPTTLYQLQKRAKRPDYFTSCLPWLQKGAALLVPMTGQLPVKTLNGTTVTGAQQALTMLTTAGGAPANNSLAIASGAVATSATGLAGTTNLYPSNLYADATIGGILVSSMRISVQLQKMAERDARSGTRYVEHLMAHWRVRSPDARLQRPEYLGGGSSRISVSPVVQVSGTSITGQTTPQANLAGVGAGVVQGHGFVKSFVEHGVIIGIIEVRADITYQLGVERMWFRQVRQDFYFPALAHVSEQAVLNQEIYFTGQTASNTQDITAFGYQERAAEYRYKPSRISGSLRHIASPTFDIWHLSEVFGSLPTLAQTFIEDQTHSILNARINAVNTEPDFYGDFWFKMITAREMPVFGVPELMDHF